MANGKCTLTVNGKPIRASMGDTLLDAALGGRVVLPHDCCSGQCESCRVTVIGGEIDDFGTREKKTVLGCLATLEGDAEIAFDPVPVVRNTRGTVDAIASLSEDLLEVRVRTAKPVAWLPGQYVRLTFKGFPARDYSPTFAFDLDADEQVLVFHVKIYPGGQLSSAIGTTIGIGHKVTVRGPFGNAYLRRQDEPLVLVSTGTGFAPVWAIAVSAVLGQRNRPIRVVAGGRTRKDLYMLPAVQWLQKRGVPVTLTAGDGDGEQVRRERPARLLGAVGPDHVVYAAGSPSQVDAVRDVALASDATFYADPFFAADSSATLRTWAMFALRKVGMTAPETVEAR